MYLPGFTFISVSLLKIATHRSKCQVRKCLLKKKATKMAKSLPTRSEVFELLRSDFKHIPVKCSEDFKNAVSVCLEKVIEAPKETLSPSELVEFNREVFDWYKHVPDWWKKVNQHVGNFRAKKKQWLSLPIKVFKVVIYQFCRFSS